MTAPLSVKGQLDGLAAYNRWANERIYADAASLGGAVYREIGLYFGGVFATLAHILRVDRTWLHLIAGGTLDTLALPPQPADLQTLYAERAGLDKAIIRFVSARDEEGLAAPFKFTSRLGSFAGRSYHGTTAEILVHMFNHQTHHRGQAHAGLTMLGVKEPKPLDLLVSLFE